MLFGKRIVNAAFCAQGKLGGGTSIKFQPMMARQFNIFLTPRFQAQHANATDFVRRARTALGTSCRVRELDTQENALQLGEKLAMIINDNKDFHKLVRKLVTLQREQGEQGKFQAQSSK